jgi:glycosyltransferase involved in cell wall biosynthesis
MLFEFDKFMKVALISQEGGGISSVSIGLGMSLARKKIETTIFTSEPAFGTAGPRTDKLNDYVEVVRLPIPDMPPRNLWFHILHSSKLLKLLSQFTVVHGVSPFSSVGYTLLPHRSRRPFVSTLHTSQRMALKLLLRQQLSSLTSHDIGLSILEFPLHDFSEKRILLHSDYVVVCSYTLFSELAASRKMLLDKVSVIQNGVDLGEIEKVKSSPANKENDISIVFAGRLFPSKGVMYLLEAFKLLKRASKNVQLNIFGEGPLQGRIGRFIADSNLGDCVNCLGRVPHERLLAEIKKSDIVVFPSIQEAQSMFMLEAMACRKPLIAFDLPFAREIVTNMDTGVLAAPGDIEDLSKKMELLVSDEKLRHRLGQAAYNHIKGNHNWNIQVEKYLRVYESVIH